MASKIKVDQIQTADGSGTIALQNQLSGLASASMPAGTVLKTAYTNTLQKTGSWTDTNTHTILSLAYTPVSASSTLHITGILTFQVYGVGNGNNFEMEMLMKEGSTTIVDGTGIHWNTEAGTSQAHFTPTHVNKITRAASNTNARTFTITLRSQVGSRRLQTTAAYGGYAIEIIEVAG